MAEVTVDGIQIMDRFSFRGEAPLDSREVRATIADMVGMKEVWIYDGLIAFCEETGKRYEYRKNNPEDPTLGKWREYSPGVKVGTTAGTAFDGQSGKVLETMVNDTIEDVTALKATANPTVVPYLTSEASAPAAIEAGVLEQSNSDGALSVVYIQATKRFLIKTEAGKYYKEWEALNYGPGIVFAPSTEYGKTDANGVAPSTSKIFFKTSSKMAFVWAGSDLNTLNGAHLQLGTTATTAFKGSDGAMLQMEVEGIKNNELVLPFYSLVSVAASETIESKAPEGASGSICWNMVDYKFLYKTSDGKYYASWTETEAFRSSEAYGTSGARGVTPKESVMYYRASTHILYAYSTAGGLQLINGEHLKLGETATTAFKGSEGAQLKSDLSALTDRVDSMENNGGVDLSEYDQKIEALQQAVFPLTVTASASPTFVEVGVATNVVLSATVKRSGADVRADSTVKLTFDGTTSDFPANKTVSVNKSAPTTLTATVSATYQGMTKSASATVKVCYKKYRGVIAADVEVPTAAQIKAMTGWLEATATYKWEHIKLTYEKNVYAYPKYLGALSDIKDGLGQSMPSSFTCHEVTIDGVEYYVYVLNNPVTVDDSTQQYVA